MTKVQFLTFVEVLSHLEPENEYREFDAHVRPIDVKLADMLERFMKIKIEIRDYARTKLESK